MKLIKPSFEIIEQEDLFKHIEKAGRTCYKSEDKITEDSATKFVEMIKGNKHNAVLEHGTIYLKGKFLNKYSVNKYSCFYQIIENGQLIDYVTTNYRVLVENGWLDDLKHQCEPTEYHEKRITVKFICDRGVSHEFVRHRVFSFAQESTRYCNYSKDKFGNELTFISPIWTDINEFQVDTTGSYGISHDFTYLSALGKIERAYFKLLEEGWTPQQARSVLPNSLKTELVMTGFISDWKHFFELRCASGAHPQARELAIPLKEEFIKRGYINEI